MYNTTNPVWNSEFVFHQQNKLVEFVLTLYYFRQLPAAKNYAERLRYNVLDYVVPVGELKIQPALQLTSGEVAEKWFDLSPTTFQRPIQSLQETGGQCDDVIHNDSTPGQLQLRVSYASFVDLKTNEIWCGDGSGEWDSGV